MERKRSRTKGSVRIYPESVDTDPCSAHNTFHPASPSDNCPDYYGDLHVSKDESLIIEWKMHNFLSLLGPSSGVRGFVGKYYRSRFFTFSSSNWYLDVNPQDGNEEWIPLYLCSTDCHPFEIVAFELGIKKDDDTCSLQETFIRKFRGRAKYGIQYFLKRSELEEKKDEISTSDSLTVVCKLIKCVSPTDKKNCMELFVSERFSDLSIIVKGQVFPAHKVVLVTSSKVFSAMFDHKMSEENSGVLNIEDCEPETFKNFLRFVYVGRTDITDSNVYQLYAIGHKYCVDGLTASCVFFMLRNLSVDNICDAATLGVQFSDNDVIFSCSEFFEENVREIVLSPQWKSLMEDHCLVAHKLLVYVAPRVTVAKESGSAEGSFVGPLIELRHESERRLKELYRIRGVSKGGIMCIDGGYAPSRNNCPRINGN